MYSDTDSPTSSSDFDHHDKTENHKEQQGQSGQQAHKMKISNEHKLQNHDGRATSGYTGSSNFAHLNEYHRQSSGQGIRARQHKV